MMDGGDVGTKLLSFKEDVQIHDKVGLVVDKVLLQQVK